MSQLHADVVFLLIGLTLALLVALLAATDCPAPACAGRRVTCSSSQLAQGLVGFRAVLLRPAHRARAGAHAGGRAHRRIHRASRVGRTRPGHRSSRSARLRSPPPQPAERSRPTLLAGHVSPLRAAYGTRCRIARMSRLAHKTASLPSPMGRSRTFRHEPAFEPGRRRLRRSRPRWVRTRGRSPANRTVARARDAAIAGSCRAARTPAADLGLNADTLSPQGSLRRSHEVKAGYRV